MPENIHEDNVGTGLDWNSSTKQLTSTGVPGVVFAGRYLSAAASSDQTATFIDADTNIGGTFAFSLRDVDHGFGMHYWIRVDVGVASLTVQREGGSTKTINGNFVGQSFSGATSLSLLRADGIVRLRPSGVNWSIY